MAFALHRLTRSTAGLLATIAPDVFDHSIRADSLAAFLGDPRHVMFLAEEDGVVIGMGSGLDYFHPDKPPHFFINEVGVSPLHQRRGIGRALVEALLDEARRRGCTFAWLGTDLTNVGGNACFSKVPGVEPAQPFNLYEWDWEA
jgi:ribosomal protein S18 acetylase RimI-like enzyme